MSAAPCAFAPLALEKQNWEPGATFCARRFCKIWGGLVIVAVCAVNVYFVVLYVAVLASAWLYVLTAVLAAAYLAFVGYLVSYSFYTHK